MSDGMIRPAPNTFPAVSCTGNQEAQPHTSSAGTAAAPAETTGRTLLIVITADKGLCGSFNSNVIKAANVFAGGSTARQVALGLVGRKGRDFFRRRGFDVRYEDVGLFSALKLSHAQAIAARAIEEFTAGRVSSVYLVYNEFKSVMTQHVIVERLLPIAKLEDTPQDGRSAEPGTDYLYEPSPEAIIGELLPKHVESQIYRALLESAAAEHAARMTAMDSATRNATDMLGHEGRRVFEKFGFDPP